MMPIPLEEPTKKDLENKLMEMPELENDGKKDEISKPIELKIEREIHHELTLSSSMVYKDRFCLGGENEEGEYITVWFDSYEFLKCVDKERLKEIKSKLIKTIKEIK
tara:strand:+ start:3808 stop:4128 length:321 start_codon:yes stop_codon:yes gene_type:complete